MQCGKLTFAGLSVSNYRFLNDIKILKSVVFDVLNLSTILLFKIIQTLLSILTNFWPMEGKYHLRSLECGKDACFTVYPENHRDGGLISFE